MNENIHELFDVLTAASYKDEAKEAYKALRFVLNRSVELALRDVTIQFSGLFAKINYLLLENKARQEFVHSMSSTRSRIRRQHETSDEDLHKSLPYDIKNLALFITVIFHDVDIPAELNNTFPSGSLEDDWDKAATHYLRVIVNTANDHIITATNEDGISVSIVYDETNRYLNFDYSYLKPLLREGIQLNIIRPRQQNDLLLPEMIILEPDYLIDISSIASAFREHGATPLNNLLKKISPSTSTQATLLGDFASQLLDEELHGKHNRPYAESIADFCQQHAMAMATCENLTASFHEEAKRQQRNIHKAISEDLPRTISAFNPDDVLLEPSFASEMLGIQGRMDFLQSDYRVLIEQKSGKAAYIPGQKGFDNPSMSLPHYVQLLLYRALLHYNYDMPNEQIRPLLLYSKYDNPLLQTDSAPQLLHEAFRLRNQLVWLELHLGENGFQLLCNLRPEQFNINNVHSKLWEQYTLPEIEQTLQPLHHATSLERAYYLRMMQFVQRENILSKIGNQRKENSGAAARWHDSLEEKRQAGNIYDMLTLQLPDKETAITHLHLTFDDGAQNESANFRIGDIVTLFPYQIGTEPDCRKSIVHRASIEDITTEGITLRLRAPQTNCKVFHTSPGWAWAVEHDFLESSYGSLYRGIHAFLSAPKERRDLVLAQRHPEVDETETLIGDYGTFNELSLRVRQAKELFLIIGPPGTGKTSFGMLNTLKEELLHDDSSVAVMAFTNRAVDEICSKLVEEELDFVRIGNELSCGISYRPYLLQNKVKDMPKISHIRDYICNQRIVVGTSSSFNSNLSIFHLRTFSLAIIDEASQILEPQLLGLLSAQCTSHFEGLGVKKFVMIGDHKQLPAVVQQSHNESKINDAELNAIGLYDCRLSLFERLLSLYRNDPSVVYMLSHQGRMHEEIASFPSREFYAGLLSCVPLPHQIEVSDTKRLQFHNVLPTTQNSSSYIPNSDKVNLAEADAIANIVIHEHTVNRIPLEQIGIIVPYRNQISAVRNAIARHSTLHSALHHSIFTIDTVERFQGSQREVIIYGFTVQRPYQLDFLTENTFKEDGKLIDRKLNVVMTRAMKRLHLVGNKSLLSRNSLFASLINYCER